MYMHNVMNVQIMYIVYTCTCTLSSRCKTASHVIWNEPVGGSAAQVYETVFLLVAERGQPRVPLAQSIPHARRHFDMMGIN